MQLPALPLAVFLVGSALVAASGLGVYWYAIESSPSPAVVADIVIDFGDGTVLAFDDVACSDATPYGLLLMASGRGGFEVASTYFAQYDSIMVDSIDGCANGEGGRYWQYYVNGEMPMEPSDAYALSNGDTVKWSYEVPAWA